MGGNGGEEPGLLAGVLAQGDGLLELIDDEDRDRSRRRECGERVHRVDAGGDHHDTTAVALQRGRHAGSHQRRLAAARWADHGEHADRGQPIQTGLDLDVAPEEAVGVIDAVGHEPQVRADGAGLGERRRDDQRRILAQDRLLQGDQVRTGLDSQLGAEHGAGLVQAAQRVGLPAGLILGQRQQRPAAFPQRRLGDAGLGLGQHLPVLAGA